MNTYPSKEMVLHVERKAGHRPFAPQLLSRIVCLLLTIVTAIATPYVTPSAHAQSGTVIFQDDFTTSSLDSTKWSVYGNDSFSHNTWFGKQPTFGSESGNGFVRLNLDTYNPESGKSGTFKGTEFFSKTEFPVGPGGVEFEARVRGTNIPAGAVFAFYTFGQREITRWPDSVFDEVDFELLGNYSLNKLWLNIWDDYHFEDGGPNEASQPTVSGFNYEQWTVYKARVYPYVTQFFINNVLVRESYNITPNDPMSMHFNIWVPNSTWTAAYNSSLNPSTSSNNQTHYFDVDYARVRSLAAGSIGNGTGLSAAYYDNVDLTGATVNRVDPTVNFDWGTGSPAPSMGTDTFSTRWSGQVQAQFSETYTFTTRSDDGVRLWVNGQKLIDQWKDQGPTEYSGTIALTAGMKYNIVLEYFDNTQGAVSQLFWSSPSTPRRIIPQTQLFPNQVVPPTPTPPPTATPTATPTPGTGTGLSATYYDNANLTGATVTRVDPQINFDWGSAAPATGIGADTFSARWTGQVQAQFTQTYTFYALADDGVRLWVNGQKLIDQWKDQGPTEYSGTIALTAGTKYSIVVEYYDNAFGAAIQLRWSSPSTPKSLIPRTQLYPPAPLLPPTVHITTPLNGRKYNTFTAIIGRVADRSSTGLLRVELAIRRVSDTKYWRGTSWGARLILPTSIVGDTWRYNGMLPTGANLLDGTYVIGATAYDRAGSLRSVTCTFVLDQTIPTTSTITSPANGAQLSTLPAITGTAIDNTGGTGISHVDLVLKRNSDSKYWTGSTWGTRVILATSLSGATWRYNGVLPTGSNLVAGKYTIAAYPYDNARNIGSATHIITVVPPAVRSSSSAPNSAISPVVLSTGEASSRFRAIRLVFTGALAPAFAADGANYNVVINGVPVPVESASYTATSYSVTLALPDGYLTKGATVAVSWDNLCDAQGRTITDKDWKGTGR
jgi:hypothetical protein